MSTGRTRALAARSSHALCSQRRRRRRRRRPVAAAPADRWTQFRGSPVAHRRLGREAARARSRCSGPTRRATRSSPRRPSSTAWSMSVADGRAARRQSRRRQAEVEVQGVGRRHRRIVSRGRRRARLHRRSRRRGARGRRATGKAAWTFKTSIGDQIVASRRGRQGAHRLVRCQSLRARRQGRQAGVEGADRRLRARHAGDRRRRGLRRRLRRDPARHPRRGRQGSARDCHRARTPARRRPWPTAARTTARTRTRCSASI